ncbi:hemoglobin/transferrin/lactoferrin receptor protein [Novosphingobium sp. PhB165]|uniref:TonB-dependent hemoglobin/transferrin/lactoferrin family receptor n=1 Tax=Novosphingobium sp. PhB165 TaxID=2485105 RepID=UPI0010EF9423|nr:TonB-dependent hemoglobin/transferrin/lactoferrin family receptor [Novosphingobium sp. PhB165]TCM15683.1 hemoglobin/transferrin/lactoferrin receptor protein [Novosphingobium sp. PhB165]
MNMGLLTGTSRASIAAQIGTGIGCKIGWAVALTLALPGAPVWAQSADQSASTDSAVPLGSFPVRAKAEDTDAESSAAGKPRVLTTTTTAETLRDRMVDSLTDFSRRVDAGVNFNPRNMSINIRGLDSNRVLTTIDGIRTPWLDDGARGVQGGVASFDFNSLSAIDVVRSADSSFFGTGALSGTLALRTLDPEDLLTDGKAMAGLSKVTYDSASDSVFLNQAAAVRSGDTLMLIQGGYQNGNETKNQGDTGGTGTTRTEPNPASYDQLNLLVKVHQYLPGGHRLGLTGEIFSRDYDENTLTSIGSTYSSFRTDNTTKRKRISGNYDYQGDGGAVREAHLTAYWQRSNLQTYTAGNRLTAPKGLYTRDSDLQVEMFGLNGSITGDFTTGPLSHAITVAGEAYRTNTSQYAAGQDNCTPAIYSCSFLHVNQSDMPDVRGTDIGLVLQDRIGFGTNAWLHVTPGIRYDNYRRSPQDTPSYAENAAFEGLPAKSSDTHWSPKVLVEAEVLSKLTLYGQWAQAFRAPSATELYLTYGGTGSYVSIGNPDLKPETSKGYEFGMRFGDDKRGLRVAYYHNTYRNFIDTVTTTAAEAGLSGSYPFGVFKYMNLDRVRIYGIEASGNWEFSKNWRTWASLAYADGKNTADDYHLNSIPPLRAILGVGYSHGNFGADLSGTAAASRNKVENPASDLNKTPSYGIIDASAWIRPSFAEGLRIQVGVYNLLDKTYYNALDLPDSGSLSKLFYSQPGRTFKATALISF